MSKHLAVNAVSKPQRRETDARVAPDVSIQTPLILEDNYTFIEPLGVGTQGKTWIASAKTTKERVAIKIVSLADTNDWKNFELCEREARLLGDIDHPNIPKLYEVIRDDKANAEKIYIVREYYEGESVQQMLDRLESLSQDEIFELWLSMLDILNTLQTHRPPIVHRDIKPSNIIRDLEGHYKLIDFGAASSSTMNATGGSTIAGTLGFMPPEQYMGKASPASDSYALAATICSLYSGVSPSDMMNDELSLDIAKYLGHVDWHVVQLLKKMLDPQPLRRLYRADEIAEKLTEIIGALKEGRSQTIEEHLRWEEEKEARLHDLKEGIIEEKRSRKEFVILFVIIALAVFLRLCSGLASI